MEPIKKLELYMIIMQHMAELAREVTEDNIKRTTDGLHGKLFDPQETMSVIISQVMEKAQAAVDKFEECEDKEERMDHCSCEDEKASPDPEEMVDDLLDDNLVEFADEFVGLVNKLKSGKLNGAMFNEERERLVRGKIDLIKHIIEFNSLP